jgi:type IV pilus assembly protein PilC
VSDKSLQEVRIPARTLVLFTRQLVTLILGGVPLIRALETLSLQTEEPRFGEVLQRVVGQVESGHPFSQALSAYPHIFSRVYVVMVKIGEESGGLHSSLDCVGHWLQRDSDMYQKLRSALTYPVFVLSFCALLTCLVFYFVLPPFLSLFADLHVPLPLVTRVVIAITQGLRSPLVVLILAAGSYALARELRRRWQTPGGRLWLYQAAAHVPLLGSILWHGSAARFGCALQALLESGNDLTRSLRLASNVSGNPVLEQDAEALVRAVMNGSHASEHMQLHPDIYSTTLACMAAAGEEASRLPEMVGRASDYHLLEMEGKVEALKASIEPLTLALVAMIVGTIIMAIFLPLYSFLDKIG